METCPDSESQVKRYHDNGWEGAWSMDMAEVYARLPRDDVARWVLVYNIILRGCCREKRLATSAGNFCEENCT